jgi:alanine-glyoxylate transaminase/serine-glyoxylate transaminase/serine-pyruvate transaminase
MGLSFVVKEVDRLPQLNAIRIPEGVDDAAVRSHLLADYGLEIGAGLGEMAGKVWRIGLMGHASNARNVLVCLAALEDVLATLNAQINTGRAVAAAREILFAEGAPLDDEG